jgi:ribosomal-protein-alanine N-acetyltransferase
MSLLALKTKRLTLTPTTTADLGCYQAFYAASDVTVGGYRGGRTMAEVAAIHQADMDHWADKGFGMFLIRTDKEEFVGGAGVMHPDGWPRHELTWFVLPAARSNGYATEASLAVIAFAYDTLGWDVVETHMRDENTAARRLAGRLGGQKIARQTFPDSVTRDVFVLPRQAEVA